MSELVPSGQLDLDAAENEEPILALVRRLERDGLIDEVSLDTSGLQDLTVSRAGALLRFFGGVHRGSAWWSGDLYLFCDRFKGEEASQLAEASGLSVETITRYVTLAREFPPSERVAGLGMSHHRLVVRLDHCARRAWLGRALAGDGPGEGAWSAARLREELQLAGLVEVRDSNPEPPEILAGTKAPSRGFSAPQTERERPEVVSIVRALRRRLAADEEGLILLDRLEGVLIRILGDAS